MTAIAKPFVNQNGTERAALVEQFSEICHSLCEAIAALRKHAPNGRDYADASALAEASRAHQERVASLSAMFREYEAVAEDLATG